MKSELLTVIIVVIGTSVTALLALVGAVLRGRINTLIEKIDALSEKNASLSDKIASRANYQYQALSTTLSSIGNQSKEQSKDHQEISAKVYDIIMADKGWGAKLDNLEKEIRMVGNNKALLLEIKEMLKLSTCLLKRTCGSRASDRD